MAILEFPSSVSGSGLLTVTGSGFLASSVVTLTAVAAGPDGILGTIDDVTLNIGSWTATANGSGLISTTLDSDLQSLFGVPIRVTATDGTNTTTSDFLDLRADTPTSELVLFNGILIEYAPPDEQEGAGSGLYDPFLAISDNDGTANGFNHDLTQSQVNTVNDSYELNTDATKTSSLKLSDIPVTVIDGVEYVTFRLDLNEANNAPSAPITLKQLKIYTSNLTTGPADGADFDPLTQTFGAGFTERYDIDSNGDITILLQDDSSGSGTDNYAFYVPLSAFGGALPADTYITLYSEFGTPPAYGEDGGFEEWKTEDAATIQGIKFADLDGDGVRDAGEGGIGGVTVWLDFDEDGILDADERSTTTAADGSFAFYGVALTDSGGTVQVREIVPVDHVRTTGDFELVTLTGEGTYAVEIGNRPLIKDINIDKQFVNVTGGNNNGVADFAGDVINYKILVSNGGNTALTNVTVLDPLLANLAAVLVSGFNIGDTDQDNQLDIAEVWQYGGSYTVTQADLDGGGNAGSDHDIDNTATASADNTTPEDDSVTVGLVYNPDLAINKTITSVTDVNLNGLVDAGDIINYNVNVANTGNVTLTGVTVTDPLLGGALATGVTLAVGADADYVGSYTITQADMDNNGGGDGDIDNTATADSNETGPEDDSEKQVLDVVPSVDIEKYVRVMQDGVWTAWMDADSPKGPAADSDDQIQFKFVVTNDGNVTLTNLVVDDDKFDLNGLVAGDTWDIASLGVGASACLVIDAAFQAGQHVNVATVTTDQDATDSDAAHYYGITEGPGVRTPGFWSQLGWKAGFWDGIAGNEKKSGTNFPTGELLDFNGTDPGTGNPGYILLGDRNGDGLAGADETTVRISLTNALKMLDASGDGGGKSFDLLRQVISAQLNLEAGNNVGDGSPGDPLYFITEGVEWILKNLDTSNDGCLDLLEGKTRIGANSKAWSSDKLNVDDFEYDNSPGNGGAAANFALIESGSEILTALNEYNNSGSINGVQFANDGDWNYI